MGVITEWQCEVQVSSTCTQHSLTLSMSQLHTHFDRMVYFFRQSGTGSLAEWCTTSLFAVYGNTVYECIWW